MIDKCFSGKGDIKLSSDFNVPIINILWQIVATQRFDLDNPKDEQIMEVVSGIFENGLITDFFPLFLAKLMPKVSGLGKMTETCDILWSFLTEIIEEHEGDLDPGHPRDFIDVYLTESRKNEATYNKNELINCIWDFFLAGTETSSTTLKWALLYLSRRQDIQDR